MRHFSFSVCISPPSPKPFEFLKHTAFLRSFETLHVDAAALKRTKWMENHHAIVLPLTGRPIKQGVDVNSVRLPWNSRKMWELAFIENLTLAFTLLYFFFFNAKCKVYKHNTVSQRCTFMQMTSSIFLLHAADQCKLKLVQSSSLDWKLQTFSFKLQDDLAEALKQKKCMHLQSSDLAHILGWFSWATLVDWAGHVICTKPSQPGVRL